MDDERRREILARAYQRIAEVDAMNEDAERRRAERAQHGERKWRLPPQPKPVAATQRAPDRHARDTPPARDWAAEQKWVERIADRVVDTKIRGLAEPIGRALATIRTETRTEVK